MKKLFGFGLIAVVFVGCVFGGCKKDEEEEIAPYFDMNSKRLLSETTVDGYERYKTEYKYDEQGNMIEIRHLKGGSDRETYKCNYKYNEYGDVVETISGNTQHKYEYDYNGNVVTITDNYLYTDYGYEDRSTYVYVDTYADSERKQLLSHSAANYTEYYTYDNEGNLIELVEYQGELIYRREITVYDENTVYFSRYYYYDYSTRIDSTHIKYVYTDSKREHIVSYEYNDYRYEEQMLSAEYTSYDSNGNISLVEVYENGILVGKQTDYEYKDNTITYYYYRVDESGEITSQTYYVLVYGDK